MPELCLGWGRMGAHLNLCTFVKGLWERKSFLICGLLRDLCVCEELTFLSAITITSSTSSVKGNIPPAISLPWGPSHPDVIPSRLSMSKLGINFTYRRWLSSDWRSLASWLRPSVSAVSKHQGHSVSIWGYINTTRLLCKILSLITRYVNHPLVSFHAAWMQMTEVFVCVFLFTCGWERACHTVESDSPNGLVTARLIDLDSYQQRNS